MKRFFFHMRKVGHKIVKVIKHSVRLQNCVRYLAFHTRNKSNKILPDGQKN